MLIQAASRVEAIKKVTIVGQTYSRGYKQEMAAVFEAIDGTGMEDRVEVVTDVPHGKMDAYYAAHDLFVLASSREPFGYSVLEAVGWGIPVICSDSTGSSHYVHDGYNGYIFKSNDLNDLVRCLKMAAGSIGKLSENSRKSSRNHDDKSFYSAFSEIMARR